MRAIGSVMELSSFNVHIRAFKLYVLLTDELEMLYASLQQPHHVRLVFHWRS